MVDITKGEDVIRDSDRRKGDELVSDYSCGERNNF